MGMFSSKPATRVDTGVGWRVHTPATYPESMVAALREAVQDGVVVLPSDEGYTHARRAWNLDAAGFPSAVCTVGSTQDISRVLKLAAQHTDLIHVAITGNGRHSHQCVPDNALVIDVSRFNKIEVDAAGRTAVVESGVVLGEIDAALAEHNMMLTVGHNPHTGITGLCLGGGMGLGVRTTGLTCDSILEVELVLASGETAVASASSNSDLLWALRGGGGNFGVVTQFTFRIHPVPEKVYAGDHVFLPVPVPCLFTNPLTAFKRAVQYVESASFPLKMTGNLILACHGPFVGNWVYMGEAEDGKRVFGSPEMWHGRTPIKTDKARPYLEAQKMALGPDGMGQQAGYYHERGVVCDSISDAMAEEMWALSHAKGAPGYGSVIVITIMGGEMSRVEPEATAFYNRGMQYFILAVAEWKKPEEADAARKWSRDVADALQKYSVKPYNPPLGDAAPACSERDLKMFGPNIRRLQTVKARYDPENLFRHNTNIVPAS